MRIFITGGAGFIGKPILKILSSPANELLLLSIDATDSALLSQYSNNTIIGNLMDIQQIKEDIIKFQPEAMIHLAWGDIPDFSFRVCKGNLDNSLQLINFILTDTDCKKIIVSGSCQEYGNRFGLCNESDTVDIDSAFAWAKYSLYKYADYICRHKGIELIWFRIFYAYGPGQRKEALIPLLYETLKKREAPVIKHPFNANDFIYNEDIAKAFQVALIRTIPSGIYNLGSGVSTRVVDICEILENRITGLKVITSRMTESEKSKSDVNFWADTRKTTHALGWKCSTSLEEGIEKYLNSEGIQ